MPGFDMNAETPIDGGRLAEVLLACLAATLTLAAVAGFGWYRASSRAPTLDRLSAEERFALLDEALERSPGIYEAAWYQPEIAYTLKPDTELEAWNDRFHSNELGFRTGPVQKEDGTFRILLIGDSWTYGMGIREQESFPKVLEALANEHAGAGRVEAWTLALPGYQTSNQVAALDHFIGRIRPDAAVFVPSTNDSHRSARVLTNGSLHIGIAATPDPFGRRHDTWYRLTHFCNSHEFLARWHLAFSRLHSAERRLQSMEIPTSFFFLARWYRPALVHWLATEAGLESPYAIVPGELTLGEWLTDLPNPHGNAAANQRYAQLLYRLLAPELGWQALPADAVHPEIAEIPLFPAPPEGKDWHGQSRGILAYWTERQIPEDYAPGDGRDRQWAGPGNPKTGAIGPSTTVLVRPPEGRRELEITVARVEGLRAFYPVELEAAIPSPSGGTRQITTVLAHGAPEHRFRVALPPDVEPGAAVDVVLTPARATSRGNSPIPESVRLLRIEPVD